jgi:PAS domain-containing protein
MLLTIQQRSLRALAWHPPGSLHGKPMQEIVGTEAFALIEPHVQKALEGEEATFEAWLPYRHGGARYVWAEYIPDRQRDGKVDGFFALVSDLTERRRAEEDIARLNAENGQRLTEMETLFDAAPIGIFVGRDKHC